MYTEMLSYFHDDLELKGFISYDDRSTAQRPAVIIAPAFRGLDDAAKQKAVELSELGYVGFAADLYGDGKSTENNDEAFKWMSPLFIDRKLLQGRLQAAFNFIKDHPAVNMKKIAVIGFCFGGLAAIELLRSGAAIRGAVSFHGVLGKKLADLAANPVPISSNISGSLLVLHGNDDPLVSLEDQENFKKEFTEAKVDWQMHIYGGAMHAFTNPAANDPEKGTVFEPKANARSWRSMQHFFEELFNEKG